MAEDNRRDGRLGLIKRQEQYYQEQQRERCREGMAVLQNRNRLLSNQKGDAVVEAAILFPIMIMIFSALVLLAIYLPTRAALQKATQYAATAIASEISDEWLFFNESSMNYYWEDNINNLPNVYQALFLDAGELTGKGENIVVRVEGQAISSKAGVLNVECCIVNKIIYKEVVVTATRKFKDPMSLTTIGFPEYVVITVTSTAVVQNGDEFVRNMDIAVDFVNYISEKFHLNNIAESISSFGERITKLLGL